LTVPVDLAQHVEALREARQRLMIAERRRPDLPVGRSVLVMDPDPAAARQLREWLEPSEVPVGAEVDFDAGVRRALAVRPAVVWLDPMPAEGDRWDVMAALSRDPVTCGVPIVVASAIENRRFAFALGARACVVKPFDRASVVRTLDELGVAAGRLDALTESAAPQRTE
jgi:CheY-like chemotaxis protein